MGTMISTTAAVKDALGVEIPEINVVGDKLIVEGEDFDYAIASDKFSPAQILMALMGNANEAFFTGKSSEQDWASKMGMMAVLTLEDIVDRNVLQGQQKFARIVDVGSPSWGKAAFGFLGILSALVWYGRLLLLHIRMKPSKIFAQLVLKRSLEKVQDKALLVLKTLGCLTSMLLKSVTTPNLVYQH